jgi:hypothetical protein
LTKPNAAAPWLPRLIAHRKKTIMNKNAEKSDYLLLFRGNEWELGLPPEELKKVVTDWYAWYQRLVDGGKCVGGMPLLNNGKLVSGKQGRTVADGPFAESKETIGGYFHLQVANEAEAVEIAQQCPGLEYDGCVVEIRPVGERNNERFRGIEHLEQLAKSVTTKS